MTIDWNKPVRTKDGRAVRVLCTDRATASSYPVLALIKDEHGDEAVYTYTIEGKYYRSGMLDLNDLENVPEQQYYYLNVYKDGSSAAYHSMEDAKRDRTSRHTGTKFGSTLHLTFEGNNLVGVEKVDQ